MSDEIEAINVRRIERLIELAHLRNTPPETLMAQLGIKARGVCLSRASREDSYRYERPTEWLTGQ